MSHDDTAFEDALRARIEAQLADVQPDFEDLMRRVERTAQSDLDPTPTPHADADVDAARDADDRRVLQPFVLAYRGRLDEGLSRVDMREDAADAARRRAWWFGLVAAAAALLLAWFASSAGLGSRDATPIAPGSTAVDQARTHEPREAATTSDSSSAEHRRASSKAPELPVDAEPEIAPEPTAAPRPAPESQPKPRQAARTKPASIDERIAALDAAAQAAWRKGEKREAQRKFQRIVDIGGKRPAVELAYGELFALGRQLGDSPTKLWRAYLQRFPRGRYAEDAKAGLCRRSTGPAARSCWSEYAKAFPGGTHLDEAAQASDPSTP